MKPRVIIWLDPGQTTGMARWISPEVHDNRRNMGILEPVKDVEVAQVENCHEPSGLAELCSTLNKWMYLCVPIREGSCLVGVESFDYRLNERYRDKIDYTAPEVIGATRLWALERPSVVLMRRTAAAAKAFWTDDKIKKVGLWVPSQRHAMDALRHLLYQITFGGEALDVDLLEKLRS